MGRPVHTARTLRPLPAQIRGTAHLLGDIVDGMVDDASIFTLGAVRCEVDGREALLHGEQPKIVLVYLCSRHRAPVSADDLAEAVWPDASGYSPAALRRIISAVRSFLRHELEGRAGVENLGGCYRLVHDHDVGVDVDVADADLRAAEELLADGRAAAAAHHARRAASLLEPTLLPGIERRWLELSRASRLRQRRRALCLSAQIESELGDHAVAVELAQAAVHLDPFDESAQRCLISAHLAAGDRGGALVVYDAWRCFLRDELGVPPSPATELLHDRAIGI